MGAICACWRTKPRNTKPANEGGPVSRQGRGISRCGNPDTPRKFEFVARAIFGCGGALPEIVRALRRGLTPNGEAMLADQFAAAAAAAGNTHAVDEIARLTWRAHAEGQLVDAEAEAINEALQGRRAAFATRRTVSPSKLGLGLPWPAKRPRSPDRGHRGIRSKTHSRFCGHLSQP